MKNLYFVSYDTTDRATILNEISRIGQAMAYAGGFLLWSDDDLTTLHSRVANIGAGQVVVVPVAWDKFSTANILNSAAQTFVTNKAAA